MQEKKGVLFRTTTEIDACLNLFGIKFCTTILHDVEHHLWTYLLLCLDVLLCLQIVISLTV